MSLSVSTAWDETAAVVRRAAGRLFTIAFLLMALPAALLQAIAPITAPGPLPEPGLWLLLVPAVPAASLIGALAICRLALRPGEGAGAAFASGLRRCPPLFGAALLIGVAAMVVMGAAILLAMALSSPLPAFFMLMLLAFFWVRLILLTPVAAVEAHGPIALIRRGWALSAGHFWRLLLFLLVAAVLSLVALIAAGMVGGVAARLAAGQPQPGTLALLLVLSVSALLQAAIGGLFTAFLARLYAQLAEGETPAWSSPSASSDRLGASLQAPGPCRKEGVGMDTFSMGGAWAFGFRFFAHRQLIHILVLIGIGIAGPLLLQLAVFGRMLGMSNPGMLGSSATGSLDWAVIMAGYLLQIASYFISWRLGFTMGRPAGGAFLFGLLASLVAVAVFALVGAPALGAGRWAVSAGIPFLGLLMSLLPLVIVFAIFYTLPAALIATIASTLLVAAMVLSAVTGNVGLAATLIGGGSGAVVVLFLVLSVALMWLATRLSCTTSVMADWKTYNLIAAIRESWRLTLEDQWVIMRYLALIAFVLGLIIIAISAVAGIGAAAFLQGEAGTRSQLAGLALGLALGIPIAFLAVLVPAGIYRELTRSSMDAEVFA